LAKTVKNRFLPVVLQFVESLAYASGWYPYQPEA